MMLWLLSSLSTPSKLILEIAAISTVNIVGGDFELDTPYFPYFAETVGKFPPSESVLCVCLSSVG